MATVDAQGISLYYERPQAATPRAEELAGQQSAEDADDEDPPCASLPSSSHGCGEESTHCCNCCDGNEQSNQGCVPIDATGQPPGRRRCRRLARSNHRRRRISIDGHRS
jgi:hypothetical protein